jgi:hypothetical protein
MGHIRLGTIPKSRKWIGVIATLSGEHAQLGSPIGLAVDDIEDIATKTLEAGQGGLEKAVDDLGLRYTFYLLTQIVLAARSNDWQNRLDKYGLQLSKDSTLFDLTAEMQSAIDSYLFQHGHSTDISEMAQRAAGEAVSALAGPRAVTLFGSGGDELRLALRELSTKRGFSELGQRFFGNFVAHYLNFFLSRVTPAYLGGQRMPQVGDVSQFNKALQLHCFQSARIVKDFCGQWYSKTEFQEGISLSNTSRFMYVALNKLRDEIKQQREGL